ncbi:MAG: hypothetical protein QM733_24690 [Ilumatobacteraceae bacterium]
MDLYERTAIFRHEEGIEKGKIEGRIEGDKKFARYLLQQNEFSDEKIAEIVGCDFELVSSIKNEGRIEGQHEGPRTVRDKKTIKLARKITKPWIETDLSDEKDRENIKP